MVKDFEQRKRSKKRRRANVSVEDAAEGGRRARKKRPAVRRNCKGVCYNQPQLTKEDKLWTGGDSDQEAGVQRRTVASQPDPEQPQHAKGEAKRRRKRRKLDSPHQLSTAVNLIAPGHAANSGSRNLAEGALQNFPLVMQRIMLEAGFREAMPVQERCWPHCLKGRDVVVIAEPGSGKTLAYLAPLAPRLHKGGEPDMPVALVLVPTRELAQQVAAECRVFRKLLGVRVATIIGGAEKELQVEGMSHKPSILIATPGRLLDLVNDGAISLDGIQCVVLDEADKMLSAGLQPQLDILRKLLLPKRKQPGPIAAQREHGKQRPQVLMFSATTTEAAETTAAKWLRKPERVQIGFSAANISRTVVQTVHVCAEHKKPQKLLKHLQQIKDRSVGLRNFPRVLIFANRVKTVRFLHQTVSAEGLRAVMLYGERSQPEREDAMKAFRSGKVQVMVATDVAARGLHIRGLPYVVNYDFPSTLEQYIHRAGRTGRLTTNGHCFSFFSRNLAPLALPLLRLLQDHAQAVDPNLVQLSEAYQTAVGKLGGAVERPIAFSQVLVADLLADDTGRGAKEQLAEEAGDGAGTEGKESRACRANKKQRCALPGRLRKKLARGISNST